MLGKGWRGALQKAKRALSDRVLGYTRHSAYRLSDSELRDAGLRLLKARPRYLVGYSAALARMARVNRDRQPAFSELKLKGVIATAEAFPDARARAEVEEVFGGPVLMEYGTVETGPMAHQRPGEGQTFFVYWMRHRLELRGGEGQDATELLVTSLYPRMMPLIRYPLGDLASSHGIGKGGLLELPGLTGRLNDFVETTSGTPIHSEAIAHCVREARSIVAFQVVKQSGRAPRLRYQSAARLTAEEEADIRRRLTLVHPEFEGMGLEHVERIELSPAGKHRMVVVEES